MKKQVLFFFSILVFILFGCEKKSDSDLVIDKKYLIGKWVNAELNTDTLFWNNDVIIRTDTITSLQKHSYHYELTEDSLKLEYNGEYYILVPKSSFKLYLHKDKSTITIEGVENYFPKYNGNTFLKIY